MSLDSFKSTSEDVGGETNLDNTSPTDVSADDVDWHISLDGYWDDVDERFYGEDTPNEPPLMNVPEKLAADMEHIGDEGYASEVADQLEMMVPSEYKSVIRITFNDFSTWNWPLKNTTDEFTDEVKHFIDRYFPEIIQWDAIVRGDDPEEELDNWLNQFDDPDYSWQQDVDNTEMDRKTRVWFNQNASWLPELRKKIKSEANDVDIEQESGDEWMDDW